MYSKHASGAEFRKVRQLKEEEFRKCQFNGQNG
jgi:hypothetical protein